MAHDPGTRRVGGARPGGHRAEHERCARRYPPRRVILETGSCSGYAVLRGEKARDDALARALGAMGSESARAPVVHGDRAAAERLRRDQLEPSRAGQPALVQGRAVAGNPGVDE